MADPKSRFSRDRPLRGVDGPTPDYVAPQTGTFGKIPRVLAGLSALVVGLAVAVIILAGNRLKVENEGLAIAGRSPVLSVVGDRTCELTVTLVVENLEKGVLTMTGTSLAIRQQSGGDFVWPEVAGEIPALALQPGNGKSVTARFPVAECVGDPAALFPRDWSISYEREDGTTGSSELELFRGAY